MSRHRGCYGGQISTYSTVMHEMLPKISLRPAFISDAQFVDDLTRRVMWEYVCKTWPNANDIEEYFKENSFTLHGTRIILLDSTRIGRITINEDIYCIYIKEFHICQEYQSKGIGRFLLDNILLDAINNDKAVKLTVLKTNPAQRLYKLCGFTTYKETKERLYMEICNAATK